MRAEMRKEEEEEEAGGEEEERAVAAANEPHPLPARFRRQQEPFLPPPVQE